MYPKRSVVAGFRILAAILLAILPLAMASAEEGQVNLKVDADAARSYDLDPIRKMLKAVVDEQRVAGCSLILIHKDKVIFEEAYGWADIAEKKPFTTDTICRLASTTKWITGSTLAALAEEGKINLQDPIGKYFPEFLDMPIRGSGAKGNPTLAQCFSHTAGFPIAAPALNNPNLTILQSVTQIAKQVPELATSPGSEYRYGGVSMQIAGGVVVKVSGMSFDDYMNKRILEPLGMKETAFIPDAEQRKRIPILYRQSQDGGLEVFREVPTREIVGRRIDGGMFSTIEDYARFLLMQRHEGMFAGKRVLEKKTVESIQQDQTGHAPIGQAPYVDMKGYGLGVAILEYDEAGKPAFIADGGAFGTCGWIDHKRDLLGVFFTQKPLASIYGFVMNEIPGAAKKAVDARKN